MIFFKQKIELETELREVKAVLKELKAESAGGVKLLQGELETQQTHLLSLEQEWEKSRMEFKTHTMALEDMLDTLQDMAEKNTCMEQKIAEQEREAEAFLELVLSYQEQMYLIESHLMKSESLGDSRRNQIGIMKGEIKNHMEACAITEIAGAGEIVDYKYHEVIEAIDTDDERKVATIAKIYRPGCVYRGNVIRKAKVAAYRMEEIE